MTKRTIEIDEDPAFQRKEWIAQRLGIGVFALLAFAAALGFTGNGGPFSHGEASEPSGAFRVEYERIVRRGAEGTMILHVHRATPGPFSFWLSADYLDNVVVESVVPAPETVTVESGRHVYSVRAGTSDVAVLVHARSTTIGWIEVQVGVVDGPTVHFRQTSLF